MAKMSAFGKIWASSPWKVDGRAAAVFVTRPTLGSSNSMLRRIESRVA
jgi:hypothetical protein